MVSGKIPFWRDARKLEIAAQIVFVLLVAAAVWAGRMELQRSFARQNIRLDWGFFRQPAGFYLSALTWTIDLETFRFKQFETTDSHAEAMIAGLSRLSRNWLVNRLALVYVEIFRNTPLLVQLFFWYFAVLLQLPNGSLQPAPIRLF